MGGAPERYEVSYLLTRSNRFGYRRAASSRCGVRSLRDRLRRGELGDLATTVLGDRYLGAEEAFERADIVHAEELSFWFAARGRA